MSILELRNIFYSYSKENKEKSVLDGASCSFESGKLYALIGRSGSGKSTIMSLMAGLDLPDRGEVIFDGKPTSEMDLTTYRRSKVSVIYQDFELFPLLTVLENIMYPMQLNGIDEKTSFEEAKKLAAKVSLPEELFDRYPGEISGGEAQRTAIARGLTMNRKLMLADEPTGNLDPENSDNIIELMLDLAHNEGRCIIIVTHDLSVMNSADIVYRLKDGRTEIADSNLYKRFE